jgi:hypothetical protein
MTQSFKCDNAASDTKSSYIYLPKEAYKYLITSGRCREVQTEVSIIKPIETQWETSLPQTMSIKSLPVTLVD